MGIGQFVRDLLKAKNIEFQTNVGAFGKVARYFLRGRIVRRELLESSKRLLEQLLNHDLNMGFKPRDVENLCMSDQTAFEWMAFEKVQVNALFNYSRGLLTDSGMRSLIKKYSTFDGEEANQRLLTVRYRLDDLHEHTIDVIDVQTVEVAMYGIRKRQWYRENQDRIVEQIRGSGPSIQPGLPKPEGSGQGSDNIRLQPPVDYVDEKHATQDSTANDSAPSEPESST